MSLRMIIALITFDGYEVMISAPISVFWVLDDEGDMKPGKRIILFLVMPRRTSTIQLEKSRRLLKCGLLVSTR